MTEVGFAVMRLRLLLRITRGSLHFATNNERVVNDLGAGDQRLEVRQECDIHTQVPVAGIAKNIA
jgi:hypothetical protein